MVGVLVIAVAGPPANMQDDVCTGKKSRICNWIKVPVK
jgi:hypothetical protein